MKSISNTKVPQNGFTLIEVLVAVLIIGIVVTAFQQVLSGFLATHQYTKQTSLLLNQGRFAMDRMVSLMRETGTVDYPEEGNSGSELRIGERLLDMYNNQNRKFVSSGDGKPDADNDNNDLVNDDQDNKDPVDIVTFGLDTSNESNWKLVETRPDYSTNDKEDFLDPRILCEHVTQFSCTVMSSNLVEILLTLENQGKIIALKTRAVAGRI